MDGWDVSSASVCRASSSSSTASPVRPSATRHRDSAIVTRIFSCGYPCSAPSRRSRSMCAAAGAANASEAASTPTCSTAGTSGLRGNSDSANGASAAIVIEAAVRNFSFASSRRPTRSSRNPQPSSILTRLSSCRVISCGPALSRMAWWAREIISSAAS